MSARLEVKFRVEKAGGHSHVAVFAGPDLDHLAKCGDITFRNEEWQLLEDRLAGLTVDGTVATTVEWPNRLTPTPHPEIDNCPAVLPSGARSKRVDCAFCAVDDEQCHADLDCEARAWGNGYCGPHQPNPGAYH